MRTSIRLAAVSTAALLTIGGAAVAVLPRATAQAATTTGGVKFAYFTQWGIYANAFYPKNLDTEGIAGKLDFLVYAFENIDPTTKTCFEADSAASQDETNPNAGDGAGDSFADYGKSYGADISVDGVAATDASRKQFVSSCIDMFIKGNLPSRNSFGGAGSGAGIFDGVDLDWEYPGAPGHTGNHVADADKANFTALLAEFRTELDALGGSKKYLTAAVPAGQDKIMHIETNKVGQYLDYANAMTYDMHGGWEATGPTNLQPSAVISPQPVGYTRTRSLTPAIGKVQVDCPTDSHQVVRERAGHFVDEHAVRLPELEVLLELPEPTLWFPVPDMYGGFNLQLTHDGVHAHPLTESWSRVVGGSGQRHEITSKAATLVEEGFV